MKIITPNKDLIFSDGSRSFTKGKEYETWYEEITERTQVKEDDQGAQHALGIWAKYFKFVKGK